MKIWGRRNSINVQKVMWTLGELGVAHERVDAGMSHGVVGEAWYGDLNPNCQVPTLEDEGVILWESNVIVRYLAARHGEGTLLPDTPAQRAVADQWMEWQQTTLHADVTFIFWAQVRNRAENQVPEKLAAAGAHLGPVRPALRRPREIAR